jgi:hypothetical protein
MKGGNMKYHMVVLLLMATLIIGVLVGGLIIVGFINLNQNTNEASSQTITISPTTRPTPRPVTNQTPSSRDPIVGSWLNGMVFYENGTVGSDGTTSWEINKNENNSYFVISDVLSPGANNPRSVSSTEWIFNPAMDKINMRGSSEFVARGIPTKKPTTRPTATTIRTQQTQKVITTISPGKFSYTDCMDTCKLNYWADHNIGLYNDCIQTCNIENLKASNV